MITVHDRAQAIARAKQAIAYLEAHPRNTKSNLGAARDQANIVQNCSSTPRRLRHRLRPGGPRR